MERGLGYSGDQTNGPGVCLAGLEWESPLKSLFPLSFLHTAVIYLARFPAFSFCFFPWGFFGLYKGQAFGGGKLYGGNHTFSKYANHTSFRLLIPHTYLAGSSYVRFYALLVSGFCVWGWGWGLDTIINGLLFFVSLLSPLGRFCCRFCFFRYLVRILSFS